MREILFQEGRPMIITITLNAALDRTQRIEHPLQVGKLNRAEQLLRENKSMVTI